MLSNGVIARLQAAKELAREAGAKALDLHRGRTTLDVISKGPQDRVTEADRAVEDLIRDGLADRFSGDAFLGEESGASAGGLDQHEGIWVVDPIDGTDCFVFGIPSWCISIAWLHRGQMTVGVIYDAIHDEMFAAARGHGAFLNDRPITASSATDTSGGLIGIGYSSRVSPAATLAAMQRLMEAGGMFHRCGSGALSLAWVAAGRLVGYFEPHINSWDCLAGLLLVREAGGWTNDFLAGDGLTRGNPAIASAPGLIDHIKFVSGLVPAGAGQADGVGALA